MYAADPAVASDGHGIVQLAISLGAGGIITSIIGGILSRRTTAAQVDKTRSESRGDDADAAAVLAGSAASLMRPMRDEMDRQAKQIQRQSKKIDEQSEKIDEMSSMLTQVRADIGAASDREQMHVRQLNAYRAWAERASKLLSEAGIQIDPPPEWPFMAPNS